MRTTRAKVRWWQIGSMNHAVITAVGRCICPVRSTYTERMGRELLPMLTLAGPVILAEIGWMSMGVVDTIMVGPLGPAAIGVSGMSNSLFFAVAVFGMGVMLGLDALVAKSF